LKKDSHLVTEDAIRPVGKPNSCYLCDAELGTEHKAGCVFRQRTIVIELKTRLLVSEPEHWDKEMIEFHFNESSYCLSNLIEELQALDESEGCICPFSEVIFIREATNADEQGYRQS